MEKIDRSDTSWSRRVPSRRWWKPPARFRVSSASLPSLLFPSPLSSIICHTVSMRRRFDDKRSLNIAKRFIIKLWRKVETEWKEFSIGSGCILGGVRGRWTTSMEEKVEKSTVNSRDSFVIIHRSIVRMALQLSFLRLSRPFVHSNDQFLFHLHSVFLSPYLFLSLFFFLTVNFDKEPFFFTRKAPYFPLPPVPLPAEHLKEDIWGFRGSRRFVTLTLNLTMDS